MWYEKVFFSLTLRTGIIPFPFIECVFIHGGEKNEAGKDDEKKIPERKKINKEFLKNIDYMHVTQDKSFSEIAAEIMSPEIWKVMDEKAKRNEIRRIWQKHNRWKKKQKPLK